MTGETHNTQLINTVKMRHTADEEKISWKKTSHAQCFWGSMQKG